MKRFYREAAPGVADGGQTILLDGRSVRTLGRNPLILPTPALADAVADEWRAQGEEIVPRSMRLTGLANAAIDRIAPAADAFAADLARYAEADVLAYRADGPASLVAAQAAAWDPLLDWACARYDVRFTIVRGIIHADQPAATIARLANAVMALDPFRLAGVSPLATLGGSLVGALAVLEGAVTPADAFEATHLDEAWQAGRWGEDTDAAAARTARRDDYLGAARFLALLG